MSDNNKDSEYAGSSPAKPDAGPFFGRVIGHLDSTYMGELEVEILRDISPGSAAEGKPLRAKMMSPFIGQTPAQFVKGDPNNYNTTQKSYGMWFVPPDVGTIVVVIFIRGNPADAVWLGCVPDKFANFMIPGIAATAAVVEGGGRVPVAEYNRAAHPQVAEATKIKKPRHPLADILETQGLLKDDTRGITTSSARREFPSSVFGISTPGPVDKKSGAPTARLGKTDEQANAVPWSRLGGTTFVMDDGDDKYLRKTHAKDGPPKYVSPEQDQSGGKVDIPHNELFRIRTRTGHQILLHNSEDLIYIGNARGTAWVELTSNGKIDIYAEDSISMHTKGDFNITADKNINLTAKANINLNATSNINNQASAEFNAKSGGATKITAGGPLDGRGSVVNLDGGGVNLMGGGAGTAGSAPIAPRVPEHEPWAGHENLHEQPLAYSTDTDTFAQIKPPEKK